MQKPQSVHCEFVADSSLLRSKNGTLRAPSATWRVKRATLEVEKSRFVTPKQAFALRYSLVEMMRYLLVSKKIFIFAKTICQ